MKWPWRKKSFIQYESGIYFIATKNQSQRLRNWAQGYKSETIYAAVNLIVQSAMGIPWLVYRQNGKKIEEVEEHPVREFLSAPGPQFKSWSKFVETRMAFLLISGNCFVRKFQGSFGKKIQIEVLNPNRMTVLEKDGEIQYEYQTPTGRVSIPREEVLHTKLFNPDNSLLGLSPIEVLARRIDINSYGLEWTISLLENEARPSGVLTVKRNLTAEQRESLREQLRKTFQGYEHAGKPMILEGDMEWKSISFSPKELEFLQSEKMNIRKIAAVYRIAPELLGDVETKTYSNFKEARRALYTEAVLPLMDEFRDEINSWLIPFFEDSENIYIDYDVTEIEALSEEVSELWKRAIEAKNAGIITINEARELLRYGRFPDRAADMLYIPANSVPLNWSAGTQEEEE